MNDVAQLKLNVTLSEVITHYGVKLKRSGSEYAGLCPFHNESTPSFYVNNEKGLYYCHGCGSSGDHIDFVKEHSKVDFKTAVTMLNGDNNSHIPPNMDAKTSIRPVPTHSDYQFSRIGYGAVHTYRDGSGSVLYKIARYEKTVSNPKKFFLPATHTSSGWVEKAPTEGRVLYNLPMLGKLPTAIVILVAGEKKCDQLQAVMTGNPVVSWMGGDTAFRKTDQSPLHNRKVIFWPDNDDGCKALVHQIKAAKLWILPIPADKPAKWDCGDAIEEGWGFDDVKKLIDCRVLYEGEKPVSTPDNTYKLPSELHGICGQIAEWINDTAYKKQPLLAINAALSFIGSMKGQRVCTERGLLTNLYSLSLGESGCGKDHPRQCLEVLADAVGLQDKMMIGVPASGTALVRSVKRSGRCLLQIDELGRVIGNINGKSSGGFQREIVDNMMMLYSSASTLFREKEYAAGREDKEKNAIVKPCLCIHAMTVPERFYDNLTTDDVIDGFLSRWMIVESDDPDPDECEINTSINDVPLTILEQLKELDSMSTNTKIGSLPTTEEEIEALQKAINPKVITITPEAKIILDEYKALARKLKNQLRLAANPLNALWVRLAENAHKIALIIQTGDTITAQDMDWSCKWVMYWTNHSIEQVKNKLSENEYDKRMKHLLAVINKHPAGITKSQLINHTKYSKKLREELLEELSESGRIIVKEENTSTKKITVFFPC